MRYAKVNHKNTPDYDQAIPKSWLIYQDPNYISLPRHITCAAHSLNVIATTDITKIEQDAFNKISKAVFKKLFSFWNLCSRSTVALDKVTELCDCKFPVPVVTRWNSMYNAVQKVVSHKDSLVLVFEELKLCKIKKKMNGYF